MNKVAVVLGSMLNSVGFS